MTYSRKQLKKFSQPDNFGSKEHHEVTQELINKLTLRQELSLAEEEYICFTINIMRSTNPAIKINPFDYEGCKNYWFRQRYLLYFNDLSCRGRTYDSKGEIGLTQKTKDREFLEKEYQKWNTIINAKRTGDKLMDYIALETQHHINKLKKYCQVALIGDLRKEYLAKSIVLHGRYIFFLVQEYFQELGHDEEKIDFFNHKVLIDSYCYVHILFRHFAALIEEHQNDKTYHYDENIDYKTIPDFLKNIVLQFKSNFLSSNFDNRSVNFILNKKTYTIWFRPFTIYKPGKIIENYLRLQTFYPVALLVDIERTKELLKVQVAKGMIFLIKKY